MAENKGTILTQEGYDKLEEELDLLKSVRRKEVAERLKVAISFGDLSENAEYDEAKLEQAQLEEKIIKLEEKLRKAEIIDESEVDTDKVRLGVKVKLMNLNINEEVEYTIVGTTESDPFNGKISNESPVGNTLLGHSLGETVEVSVPDGIVKFKILEIAK